jgi:hypothetical protein
MYTNFVFVSVDINNCIISMCIYIYMIMICDHESYCIYIAYRLMI